MLFSIFSPEEEAKLKKRVLDKLADFVPLMVIDRAGHVVAIGSRSLEDLQVRRGEILGMSVTDLVEKGLYSQSTSLSAIHSNTDYVGITTDIRGNQVISNSRILRNMEGEIDKVISFVYSPSEVSEVFDDIIAENRKKQDGAPLRKGIAEGGDLIFQSERMEEVVNRMLCYAAADNNILLTGESGVGKDIFSRLIHRNSPRRDKPFVPVFIPAISPSLLESELFGYERGAFTNANSQGKPGLFELANGGTVFLDEIGDIPYELQVKLLRVVENQEIIRMGGTERKKLDIRVISATNKDLDKGIREGTFRGDLLYRICGTQLRIPPLRERREDVRPLAEYFLKELGNKYQKECILSNKAISCLQNYTWPGNVRELKNVIEQLVISSTDLTIVEKDVLNYLSARPSPDADVPRSGPPSLSASPPLESISEPVYLNLKKEKGDELSTLLSALRAAGGNCTEAARTLCISRTTLYKKMAKYNIKIIK